MPLGLFEKLTPAEQARLLTNLFDRAHPLPSQWNELFKRTKPMLRDPTADIRFSIDALLKSRGFPQVDGPAAACFWAGGKGGAWHEYVQYANGCIQPYGAPRVRDRTLSNADEIISNAVKTMAILCDRCPSYGIVWRVHPEIGTEHDGPLYWRARLAFVPVADMGALSLDRPEWVDPNAQSWGDTITWTDKAGIRELKPGADGVVLLSSSHPIDPSVVMCVRCGSTDVTGFHSFREGKEVAGAVTYGCNECKAHWTKDHRPSGITGPESREPRVAWPDPTPEMLHDPMWLAIWNAIKTWDVAAPRAYSGYCGATGNHARAIYDAIRRIPAREPRDRNRAAGDRFAERQR